MSKETSNRPTTGGVAARETGVGRAIPFTGEDDVPAQRVYRGLGFEPVGDDAITLFSG